VAVHTGTPAKVASLVLVRLESARSREAYHCLETALGDDPSLVDQSVEHFRRILYDLDVCGSFCGFVWVRGLPGWVPKTSMIRDQASV
jgi:hypothetical protein